MDSIPGLHYVEDYLSTPEEAGLLRAIDEEAWTTQLRRRVQHYGYDYAYRGGSVTPSIRPLPDWSAGLLHQLAEEPFIRCRFDQMIVNEYLPGQGIAPHVDRTTCFGGVIASVSLGSPAEMVFVGPTGERRGRLLRPGSLLVLRDEARFVWRHGIPARKSDRAGGVRIRRSRRVSLTFRIILPVSPPAPP